MNRMKDDLISRKALMEEIQSFRCSITGLRAGKGVLAHAADEYRKSILQIIDNQPTAFNKEKVIEELKSWEKASHDAGIQSTYAELDNKASGYYQESRAYHRAIEIVEKGVLN